MFVLGGVYYLKYFHCKMTLLVDHFIPIPRDPMGESPKLRMVGEPWNLPSLKLTASLPLKMDGWNTILSYWGFGLFSGANLLLVSGRVNTNLAFR